MAELVRLDGMLVGEKKTRLRCYAVAANLLRMICRIMLVLSLIALVRGMMRRSTVDDWDGCTRSSPILSPGSGRGFLLRFYICRRILAFDRPRQGYACILKPAGHTFRPPPRLLLVHQNQLDKLGQRAIAMIEATRENLESLISSPGINLVAFYGRAVAAFRFGRRLFNLRMSRCSYTGHVMASATGRCCLWLYFSYAPVQYQSQ